CDRGHIQGHQPIVHETACADPQITSVIHIERRPYHDVLADIAQQLFQHRLGRFGLPSEKPRVLVRQHVGAAQFGKQLVVYAIWATRLHAHFLASPFAVIITTVNVIRFAGFLLLGRSSAHSPSAGKRFTIGIFLFTVTWHLLFTVTSHLRSTPDDRKHPHSVFPHPVRGCLRRPARPRGPRHVRPVYASHGRGHGLGTRRVLPGLRDTEPGVGRRHHLHGHAGRPLRCGTHHCPRRTALRARANRHALRDRRAVALPHSRRAGGDGPGGHHIPRHFARRGKSRAARLSQHRHGDRGGRRVDGSIRGRTRRSDADFRAGLDRRPVGAFTFCGYRHSSGGLPHRQARRIAQFAVAGQRRAPGPGS